MALLNVKNLCTRFATHDGEVCAVNDISFSIKKGECLGVVGESGSGKTQAFLTIMGLLAKNGCGEGEALFMGKQILGLSTGELNRIRGVNLSMIFQDPMTSLNPYLRISRQMNEVLMEHKGMGEAEAAKRSIELLDMVGIPESGKRFNMYPHEFSGGMRQRVMIAIALLCEPELLIADEPTTALDVTVQAQILDLIADLGRELSMATVLITHDLGVIAGLADRVMVMYGGRIVEQALVKDLFKHPLHPYSKGLLNSMPRIDGKEGRELSTIHGQPPDLQALPSGCAFRPRCSHAMEICETTLPLLTWSSEHGASACHLDEGHL